VPSNDPDTFPSSVRLASLEALRIRLGDGFYLEAMRQVGGQTGRSVPAEKQYHVREETLVDEHRVWNGLRFARRSTSSSGSFATPRRTYNYVCYLTAKNDTPTFLIKVYG
jgi:hypothetical protein